MKIDNAILSVLSEAQIDTNELRLVGQLDRNMYVKVNKVLEAAGGKWNKKIKAHIFDGDASERVEQMILTGEIEIPKDEFDFFPTPSALVDHIISLAKIEKGMLCLEPSAGSGNISSRLANIVGYELVHCVELNPKFAKELTNQYSTTEKDFLNIDPNPIYDRIVMNPPFSKRQDVKHVLHAYNFLKKGGILVAIMGSGVTFRKDSLTVKFSKLLNSCESSIAINPEGSFKQSGTMVNTVSVVLRR